MFIKIFLSSKISANDATFTPSLEEVEGVYSTDNVPSSEIVNPFPILTPPKISLEAIGNSIIAFFIKFLKKSLYSGEISIVYSSPI